MTSFIHERMRFCFIHVPKTGGHTITRFFAKDRKRVWRNDFSSLNERLPIHAGYKEMHDRMGGEIDSYFSFAFYRNTWDYIYSVYRYVRRTPLHPKYVQLSNLSFEDFVLYEAQDFYRPQAPLVSMNGHRCVTRLEDFRGFGSAFRSILHDLGYEPIEIGSHNVSKDGSDYKQAYTKEMVRKIGDLYEEDIEFFRFKF